MEVLLEQVGKRYQYEWIFRNLTGRFVPGEHVAITGPNGSGKSTLIRILTNHLTPSRGTVSFALNAKKIPPDQVYRHLSLAAPYMDLIEEFTLWETLDFHFRLKPLANGLKHSDVIELSGLQRAAGKQIRYFSSGMKQRTKLALAFCTDTPLLLLDEPTTNLDDQGVAWYRDMVVRFATGRTLVIASNVAEDFDCCTHHLQLLDYK